MTKNRRTKKRARVRAEQDDRSYAQAKGLRPAATSHDDDMKTRVQRFIALADHPIQQAVIAFAQDPDVAAAFWSAIDVVEGLPHEGEETGLPVHRMGALLTAHTFPESGEPYLDFHDEFGPFEDPVENLGAHADYVRPDGSITEDVGLWFHCDDIDVPITNLFQELLIVVNSLRGPSDPPLTHVVAIIQKDQELLHVEVFERAGQDESSFECGAWAPRPSGTKAS